MGAADLGQVFIDNKNRYDIMVQYLKTQVTKFKLPFYIEKSEIK